MGYAAAQLQGGARLVIQCVVGELGVGILRGWRRAWVARAAGRGRGLCADDGRGAVDLAEVCERKLSWVRYGTWETGSRVGWTHGKVHVFVVDAVSTAS